MKKTCLKCKKEKEISCFGQHKSGKNKGYYKSSCVLCCREYDINYKKKYPWRRAFIVINARCNNKNINYYKKGIKNQLTRENLEYLWHRDNACLMKKPSIDREDSNGNYTLSNCRFIEHTENCGRSKRKPVVQLTLDGKFVKEWISFRDAQKDGFDHSQISKYCAGKIKTCKGFIWRLKDTNKG